MSALHKFTAKVRWNKDLPPVAAKTGEGWTIMADVEKREATITFSATDGLDAAGRVHFVFQRHGRGVKKKGEKKAYRYGPSDYVLVQLRHPGTGDYPIPGGKNPDMSIEGLAELRDLQKPRYEEFKFKDIIETQAVAAV